ncbi:MAG: hypothetical protein KAJ18_11015 [Candidatus Omnitrophica bacterium]|nr:hypothetical protein [Candidatus Omnitrophota bacterium]
MVKFAENLDFDPKAISAEIGRCPLLFMKRSLAFVRDDKLQEMTTLFLQRYQIPATRHH